MGQAFGIPEPAEGIKPFSNLPREAVQSIWTSYNLLGEGWGLDYESTKSIFSEASYLVEKIGKLIIISLFIRT